jgi:hypothetical protein
MNTKVDKCNTREQITVCLSLQDSYVTSFQRDKVAGKYCYNCILIVILLNSALEDGKGAAIA